MWFGRAEGSTRATSNGASPVVRILCDRVRHPSLLIATIHRGYRPVPGAPRRRCLRFRRLPCALGRSRPAVRDRRPWRIVRSVLRHRYLIVGVFVPPARQCVARPMRAGNGAAEREGPGSGFIGRRLVRARRAASLRWRIGRGTGVSNRGNKFLALEIAFAGPPSGM